MNNSEIATNEEPANDISVDHPAIAPELSASGAEPDGVDTLESNEHSPPNAEDEPGGGPNEKSSEHIANQNDLVQEGEGTTAEEPVDGVAEQELQTGSTAEETDIAMQELSTTSPDSETNSTSEPPTSSAFPFATLIPVDTSGAYLPEDGSFLNDPATGDGYDDFPPEHTGLHRQRTSIRPPSAPKPQGPPLPSADLSKWIEKPYLGGFRHRKTGTEFFHAAVQTVGLTSNGADTIAVTSIETDGGTDSTNLPRSQKVSRDTQTKDVRNAGAQSRRDAVTQMNAPATFISSSFDRVVFPSRYVTARDWERSRHKAAITIQCWVRTVFSRRLVAKLRREKAAKEAAVEKKEKKKRELLERKKHRDLEARLRPRTERDFEKLYSGLETWRLTETAKIEALNLPSAERLARLASLLDEEAGLIQKLDRMRVAAGEENRERRVVKMLDKNHQPSPATGGNERIPYVLVDTPHTIRARELRDLYHALCVPLLPVDERLQVLLHVKYTVKEFDCSLTRDIVELIDREGDLLSRGRDPRSLEGLRKRLCTLFFQFTMTPEFNPASLPYQKVLPRPAPTPPTTYDPSVVAAPYSSSSPRDQAVYYCKGCNLYLPSTKFYLSTTMRYLGKCRGCICRENTANQRRDEGRYSEMLRAARAQEAARAEVKAINDATKREVLGTPGFEAADAFSKARNGGSRPDDLPSRSTFAPIGFLQEADMRYLVDTIWNGCSAISGVRTPSELVLAPWNPKLPLAPDNCILLTKAEARTHEGALAAQVPLLSRAAMEEAVKGGVLEGLDPNALYSEDFAGKVRGKHVLAKQVFKQLPEVQRYVKQSL
ncbi:hypothetical protein HDU93_000121 [Gonapodya sp. JEL0774]|nr:hypothetical protein HDU93_000121 [Gonapodya sp. JEL0774]